MAKTYQVIKAAVLVTQDGPLGPMKLMLYTNAILGPGATDAEIKHLLEMKMICEVGGEDVEAIESGSAGGGEQLANVSTAGDGPPASVPDVEAQRAAARAKLPADGSTPQKNAAAAVWVEYAVTKGYAYEAAVASTRDELITLLAK